MNSMNKDFLDELYADHKAGREIPSPSQICGWLNELMGILFPEFSNRKYASHREFTLHLKSNQQKLFDILLTLQDQLPQSADEIEQQYIDQLPIIREQLLKDANAILAGDPAAVSKMEVIRTYPGFFAIAVFRLAHEFYQLGVPLIPRILTEHAHGKTGIDIHPGATIGENFCIDHGTGVVIGETVNIGDNVKLYQGVTLGALSVKKEMAKTKRHPTIEDRVIIYSGATILGGDTIIGHDSIIGGNVWITKSVQPHCRIYYTGYVTQKHQDAKAMKS
ncbi:MAG: serine O-acetyltransferase [Bacteroidota bacterium]